MENRRESGSIKNCCYHLIRKSYCMPRLTLVVSSSLALRCFDVGIVYMVNYDFRLVYTHKYVYIGGIKRLDF